MTIEQGDLLQRTISSGELGEGLSPELSRLAVHLRGSIVAKLDGLANQGKQVTILDPDWCREHPAEAGQMHADVIVKTYSSTYALPNKDPEANRQAILAGSLDLYFMLVDDEVTGTTCLVDTGDGRAELGRSASEGGSGNTIIQDLRILDWLANLGSSKYHTLFTTLRSAPDRIIDDTEGDFVMRGGQAVTGHWRKFPGLRVNGIAPLYRKHGQLEQFTCASISKNVPDTTTPIFIAAPESESFVAGWHAEYGQDLPMVNPTTNLAPQDSFAAHYPPAESGLTDLVHADIVAVAGDQGNSLEGCIREVVEAGSPFTQIVMPIDCDTRELQLELVQDGYQVFGYQQATDQTRPALLYGKVRPGTPVVSTHWDAAGATNPFWQNREIVRQGKHIAQQW